MPVVAFFASGSGVNGLRELPECCLEAPLVVSAIACLEVSAGAWLIATTPVAFVTPEEEEEERGGARRRCRARRGSTGAEHGVGERGDERDAQQREDGQEAPVEQIRLE